MTAAPKPGTRAAVILAAALVAAGGIVLIGQRGFTVMMDWPSFARLGDAGMEAVFTLLLFGVLTAVALIALGIEGRRLAGGTAATAAIGLAIGVAGMTLAMLLAMIAGLAHPGGASVTHGIALVALGTVVVTVQATAEEVYFRGWLQPALVRGWGAIPGVAVAALAFAALHIAGGARSPLTLLNLFLAGLVFGMIALRTGGIAAAATAHAGWNWAEAQLFGLDPNPGVGSFGAILDLDLIGSPWWGGSAEGLNASIAATLVLTALLIPLLAWRPARRGLAVSLPPASG